MKRIFLLTAAVLVWGGTVMAGDLKVAVPVDEFKQIKSRLEALENENGRLRQELTGMKVKVQERESQNRQLSERPNQPSAELLARLEAVEKEHQALKDAVQARVVSGEKISVTSGGEDSGLAARLNVAENDNEKLRQEIKLLREGQLAENYASSKISAREQYYIERRSGVGHVYKF